MVTFKNKAYNLYFTLLTFLFSSLFLVSCKENTDNEVVEPGTNLSINVSVVDDIPEVTLAKSATIGATHAVHYDQSEELPMYTDKGDFRFVSTFQNDLSSTDNSQSNAKLASVGTKNLNNINTLAATSLTPGHKYRFILYETNATNSPIISSTIGTAGTALVVPVEKGKSYYWVAYSYNNTSIPADPTANDIPADIFTDLIYASGLIPQISTAPGDIKIPLNILLKHQLARVNAEVDASTYPGTFLELTTLFGENSYFKGGTLNLKTGAFTPNAAATPLPGIGLASRTINFANISPSLKRATYYTAPGRLSNLTNGNTQMSMNISSVSIITSNGFKSASNSGSIYFTPGILAAGSSYTAKISLRKPISYDITKLKILEVGTVSYYKILPASQSGVANPVGHRNSGLYAAMYNPTNFGTSGRVITNGYKEWNITSRDVGSGGLGDLNSAGYKLLIVSYDYRPTTTDVNAIQTFVSAGGRVLYYGENLEDSPGEKALVKYYSGSDTHSTGSKSNGVLSNGAANDVYWRLGSTTNNEILNGSFGTGANQNIYNDANAGHSLVGADPYKIDVLATDADFPSNVVFFKSKTSNFYWIGDGGFTVYNPDWTGASQSVGNTSYPFLLNANKQPIISSFGNSVWASTKVANSVIIMNLIEKWLKEVQ